jgi:superfamily I DNA/RNA helicase
MWSTFQETIFSWLDRQDKTHLMIKAGAGCGKTTTIVELYKRLVAKEPSAKVQFLAFNKKIADELQARGVPAATMNSYGFKAVIKAFPKIKLDADKVSKLAKKNGVEYRKFGIVRRCVSLMKHYLEPKTADVATVQDYISRFELAEPGSVLLPILFEQIQEVFKQSLQDCNTIDFDDQIVYPHYHQIGVPQCDYMIVDEAQDLSPSKLDLVSRGVGRHFICVGDPLQAIYGFCGADSESMDKIIEKFKPVVMPLPVTYRCGKNIVAEVHRKAVCPSDFQAGEDNHGGEVRSVPQMVFEREVAPKDFVLCRVSAPLVGECFNLIKRGVRAQIIGRDMGKKLSTLAEKINERAPTSPHQNEMVAFCEKMSKYEEIEVGKLRAQNKETQAESLEDQLACLQFFVDNAQTFAEMQKKMNDLFDDTINPFAVMLSTIHKAKGLEAEKVWALPFKMRKITNEKKAQEEKNLVYVQITRAKMQFNYVEEK